MSDLNDDVVSLIDFFMRNEHRFSQGPQLFQIKTTHRFVRSLSVMARMIHSTSLFRCDYSQEKMYLEGIGVIFD